MSVKYEDKLLNPYPDQINDEAVNTTKVKSSAYIQGVIDTFVYNIDKIGAVVPSVKGIVGTYADLTTYDTTKLVEKDIVYVLSDETHDDRTSYYRWTGTQPFEYIGSLADYYTPTEVDTFLSARQDKLINTINIKSVGGVSLLGSGDMKVGYYLNIMYPIGSIYMTTDKDFKPSNTFGGRWGLVPNGYILYATGDEFPNAESYGGSDSVLLTSNNIPRHTHTMNPHTHSASTNGLSNGTVANIPSGSTYWAMPVLRGVSSRNNDGEYDDFQLGTAKWETSHTKWTDTDWLPIHVTANPTIISVKSGANSIGYNTHENRPPSYTVFMWKRIS